MKQTIQLVEQWAEEKGILSKATPLTQAVKTQEEVNELYHAILDDNRDEIKDAIGDIMVTLIIQCKMQVVPQKALDQLGGRTCGASRLHLSMMLKSIVACWVILKMKIA